MKCRRHKHVLLILILTTSIYFLSTRMSGYRRGNIRLDINRTSDAVNPVNDHPKIHNPDAKKQYPIRQNMEPCKPTFGKVTIFVGYLKSSIENHYKVAQESLQCYLKTTNYTLLMIDLDNDGRVKKECRHHREIFFKKHCAASAYLRDTDWLLVLDADTGVANPNHCIEEWIDDRVDLIVYERFFNYEVVSGNYLVRKTEFAYNFLKKWSDWEFMTPSSWHGADNGVLQIHILQTVMPFAEQEIENCNTIWQKATDYESYLVYVTCCKMALGANRLWAPKLRIFRRAHGFARDGFLAGERFCSRDFMFHGWKRNIVGEDGWQSPFNKNLNVSLCGEGMNGWDIRKDKNVSCQTVKESLSKYEVKIGNEYPKEARVIPHLSLPDIRECYPNCDDNV